MRIHESLELNGGQKEVVRDSLERIKNGESLEQQADFHWPLAKHYDAEVNKASRAYWEAEQKLIDAVKARFDFRESMIAIVKKAIEKRRFAENDVLLEQRRRDEARREVERLRERVAKLEAGEETDE